MSHELYSTTENKEKEPFSFEKWLDYELPSQYSEKVKILNELGIIHPLRENIEHLGIIGIDGKEYILPEQEKIKDKIRQRKEIYLPKMEQGFQEIEITPFALPMSKLIKIAEEEIIKHFEQGKLFSLNKDGTIESLELNEDQPIWIWDELKNSDVKGTLFYGVKKYDKENHGGKTKQEILNSPQSFPGFQVFLREKDLYIPRQGDNQIIGGRKRLEAGQSSKEYLNTLQTNPIYANEQGYNPEKWLTTFIANLKKTNHVLDDWRSKGVACRLFDCYLPAAAYGSVPYAGWDRGDCRARLAWDVSGYRVSGGGGRASVGV